MGFGTLFIGYFFLINISYYTLTDLLCGVIMLLALSSLSRFNKPMRVALVSDAIFSVIGLAEFVLAIADMFYLFDGAGILALLLPLRHVAVGVLSVCLLLGIRSLAIEVGLEKLGAKCQRLLTLPALTYLLCAILDIPSLFPEESAKSTQIVALIVLLMTLLSVALLLSVIHTAYMRICMPEDADMPEKPSRFAFINRYREKQEQKSREAAEELARLRAQKLKRKKKK
jgi:hypothetical protein